MMLLNISPTIFAKSLKSLAQLFIRVSWRADNISLHVKIIHITRFNRIRNLPSLFSRVGDGHRSIFILLGSIREEFGFLCK